MEPPVARRPAVFRGWLIVAVALVVNAFSTGIGVWGVSLFALPMTREFGWSRAAFFGAATFRSLAAGAIAPLIGPLQDSRSGPRLLLIITVLCMAASMALLKFVDSLLAFYALFGALGAVMVLGGGDMLLTVVIPKWFIRYRRRALTIASAGSAVGPMLFPVVITFVLQAAGWRETWLLLGVGSLVVLLPLATLVRTQPEDLGELPDGAAAPPATAGSRPSASPLMERSLTRAEALRTASFWLLALSAGAYVTGVTGLQTNWLLYFQDVGFSATTAALSSTVYGMGAFSARFLWGFMSERMAVRHLMALQTLATAVTVALFFVIHDTPSLFVVAMLHGLALGGQFILRPLIVAEYFGRRHLGAINGVMRPFNTLASAFGPLIIATLFDASGGWTAPLCAIIALWVVSAATVAGAAPPAGATGARTG